MREVMLKGGQFDGKKVRVGEGQHATTLRESSPPPSLFHTEPPRAPAEWTYREYTYQRTGEVVDGVAVFELLAPVVFKGGRYDGTQSKQPRSMRRIKMADIGAPIHTYKRTGEVVDGVAVFRWEGEL